MCPHLFRRRWLSTLLVAVVAAAPAAAASSTLQATGTGGELVLRGAGSAARLQLPGGRELSLALPGGAEITALAGTTERWAAVGTTAARDGRTGLVVFAGDAERAQELPLPGPASARLRTHPVPLVGEHGLAGLAWLEGAQRGALAVHARAWDGGAWGAEQVVAPAGRGTQIALSGAVLADGSWLLVWAAYDGTDDEILWSRQRDGEWTAPRRVAADNAVPDITPAVVATERGAVLAWSRYDGSDYRLVSADFDGSAWGAVETVGPAGSLYPTFVAASAGSYLLYRTAVPRGWQVIEVGAQGGRGRLAAVTVTGSERPLVLPAGSAGVRFEFAATGEGATVSWQPRRRAVEGRR